MRCRQGDGGREVRRSLTRSNARGTHRAALRRYTPWDASKGFLDLWREEV
jgi:hypothetical protein